MADVQAARESADPAFVHARLFVFLLPILALGAGCTDPGAAPASTGADAGALDAGAGVPDADVDTVPRFTTAFTVDLDWIDRISRFRSGVGHDFSDSRESCRSMKHYLCPHPCAGAHEPSWTTLAITSPVSGTVARLEQEQTAGTQVQIEPDGYAGWTVRIFHVSPTAAVVVGAHVAAGERIGTHASDFTMSDVAVEQRRPDGDFRRVSIFDTMTDAAFASFVDHGLATRAALQITAAERDADPLVCDGERFLDEGSLENWLALTERP
jgi:hypothetical protein